MLRSGSRGFSIDRTFVLQPPVLSSFLARPTVFFHLALTSVSPSAIHTDVPFGRHLSNCCLRNAKAALFVQHSIP